VAAGLVGLAVGGAVVWGAFQMAGGGIFGGPTYYLHWSCGSSGQCAQVMGGQSGTWSTTYSSLSDCQATQDAWAANNTMQKGGPSGGTWCDTNSS
jgi:hypothetical protein